MSEPPRQDWSELLGGDRAASDALWELTADYAVDVDVDVDEAWARMSTGLRARRPAPRARARPHRRWRRFSVAAAAAAVLLVVANWLAAGGPERASYANTGDSARSVELPDASTVRLEPGASLEFADDDVARQATLRGRARFQVASDAARPFSVEGAGFRLVVVGTEFSVVAGEPSTVVVHEGHVRLRGSLEADWVDLRAGDSAAVVGHLVRLPADSPPDRPLSFASAPLSEVVAALSAEGVAEIEVPSALSACEVAGDFTGQSADEVAEVLALTFGASVRRRGERYVLRGGSCTSG